MKQMLSLLTVGILLLSCSSTQIVVNHPRADIYVDNINLGKGSVEIPRMGPPKRKQVMVRYNGETIGNMEIKRKFDVVTAVLGLYTYGIGLVVGWRYPAVIMVPTEGAGERESANTGNPWKQPPKLWGKQ